MVRGLMQRLLEARDEKFLRFFALVQEEAKRHGGVFFLDYDGICEFENDEIMCEELHGWLIPEEKADEFEAAWRQDPHIPHDLLALDAWYGYMGFTMWSRVDGEIQVRFYHYGEGSHDRILYEWRKWNGKLPRGLLYSEGEKFFRYFALVQEAAKKYDSIFFLETGEGHDLVNDELDCEDLFGWLVPEAEADEFEAIWRDDPHDLEALAAWDDVLGFAIWEMVDGKLHIYFRFFDDEYNETILP